MKTVVLVSGGRDFGHPGTPEAEFIFRKLSAILASLMPNVRIVAGGARGVDSAAEAWANLNGVEVAVYPADWKRHGKAAGHLRNKQMLDEEPVDFVIAFPGGRGTENMISQARKRKIGVVRVRGCLPLESGV